MTSRVLEATGAETIGSVLDCGTGRMISG